MNLEGTTGNNTHRTGQELNPEHQVSAFATPVSELRFEPSATTMHQHPRPSPTAASPANSPRTNPTRTNNPREELPAGSRASSGRGTPSEQGIGVGEGADTILRDPESASQGRDSVAKLNQIIQVCPWGVIGIKRGASGLTFNFRITSRSPP